MTAPNLRAISRPPATSRTACVATPPGRTKPMSWPPVRALSAKLRQADCGLTTGLRWPTVPLTIAWREANALMACCPALPCATTTTSLTSPAWPSSTAPASAWWSGTAKIRCLGRRWHATIRGPFAICPAAEQGRDHRGPGSHSGRGNQGVSHQGSAGPVPSAPSTAMAWIWPDRHLSGAVRLQAYVRWPGAAVLGRELDDGGQA
jgi:hypothetical protein